MLVERVHQIAGAHRTTDNALVEGKNGVVASISAVEPIAAEQQLDVSTRPIAIRI